MSKLYLLFGKGRGYGRAHPLAADTGSSATSLLPTWQQRLGFTPLSLLCSLLNQDTLFPDPSGFTWDRVLVVMSRSRPSTSLCFANSRRLIFPATCQCKHTLCVLNLTVVFHKSVTFRKFFVLWPRKSISRGKNICKIKLFEGCWVIQALLTSAHGLCETALPLLHSATGWAHSHCGAIPHVSLLLYCMRSQRHIRLIFHIVSKYMLLKL